MAKLYSADEVSLTIGGRPIDSGFADGEFITIEESAPRVVTAVGTDGEVAVSRNNDRRATVTVKLMSTSDGNDVLQDLADLNEEGPGLPGVSNLYIRDRNGRALHEGDHCWVEEMPAVSYDRGATTREWKLGVSRLRNTVRGNNNAA